MSGTMPPRKRIEKGRWVMLGTLNNAGWWRFIPVFAFLVVVQLPFLLADGDVGLGWSCGPFTDEGLYTAQARNYLITGTLDLSESDALIKTPLFGLIAALATRVFGDSMLVMRMACLVLASVAFAAAATGSSRFSTILRLGAPLVMISYFPFHYGHLAMAELLCLSLIILMTFLVGARLSGGSGWTIVAASAVGFATYALKVQFFYVAAIPPLAFAMDLALTVLQKGRPSRQQWENLALSTISTALLLALFFAIWIYPNKTAFFYVIDTQTSQRIPSLFELPHVIIGNVFGIARTKGAFPLIILSLFASFALIHRLFRNQTDEKFRDDSPEIAAILIPLFAWLCIELHKLAFSYLPSRLYLTLIVAFALFSVALLVSAIAKIETRPFGAERFAAYRGMPIVLKSGMFLVLLANAWLYGHALLGRTFVIRQAQLELNAAQEWEGKVVVGAWASSLFWGTEAVTKPVWAGYFNDRNILSSLHPVAIVTEPDEDNSDRAFSKDGITFSQPPLYSYKIANWQVNVHILGKPAKSEGVSMQ